MSVFHETSFFFPSICLIFSHPLDDGLQQLFLFPFGPFQISRTDDLLLLIHLCDSILYPFKDFIIALPSLIIPLPEVLEDLNLVFVFPAESQARSPTSGA